MSQAPVRTCVGCLKKKAKEKLIRLVVKRGQLVTDPTNKSEGRGVYLCRKGKEAVLTCLALAKKKDAFKKVFKEKIKPAANRRGLRPH